MHGGTIFNGRTPFPLPIHIDYHAHAILKTNDREPREFVASHQLSNQNCDRCIFNAAQTVGAKGLIT